MLWRPRHERNETFVLETLKVWQRRSYKVKHIIPKSLKIKELKAIRDIKAFALKAVKEMYWIHGRDEREEALG